MAFRNQKYIKSYNYNKWRPFVDIPQPAAGAKQIKNNIKIVTDETNSLEMIDWYNAYFVIKVRVVKDDNTNYNTVADRASLINGSWMLINQLVIKYNNIDVIMERNINQCVNIKVLNEFDKGYATTVTQTMLNYIDINGSTAAANTGHMRRMNLTAEGATTTIQLPLRLYGFFAACKNQLLPNGRLSFDITLEDDDVLIDRTGANAGKVIVRDIELYAPKLNLMVSGLEMFSKTYLQNRMWRYMKESFYTSALIYTSPAYFKIVDSVHLPQHLFVWDIKSARASIQTEMPVTFDAFNVTAINDNDAIIKLTDLQLVIGGSRYMPYIPYDAETGSEERIYHNVMEYGWGYSSDTKNLQISLTNFKTVLGFYYFNLTHLDDSVKEGRISLELRWKQSHAIATTADGYLIRCALFHEGKARQALTSGAIRHISQYDKYSVIEYIYGKNDL